jgi:hypothetical protein
MKSKGKVRVVDKAKRTIEIHIAGLGVLFVEVEETDSRDDMAKKIAAAIREKRGE